MIDDDAPVDRTAQSVNPPWAYIAHKGGYWAGVASATLPAGELSKFLVEFATDGFDITTVHNRDEYNRLIDSLGFWHDRPGAEPEAAELPL